jgi:hypothetical protein
MGIDITQPSRGGAGGSVSADGPGLGAWLESFLSELTGQQAPPKPCEGRPATNVDIEAD